MALQRDHASTDKKSQRAINDHVHTMARHWAENLVANAGNSDPRDSVRDRCRDDSPAVGCHISQADNR